jgi:4-aminobutyrate aminotransferase-like enzyme/Ser/Thr protein kinase RdoA (MazF antagonist)
LKIGWGYKLIENGIHTSFLEKLMLIELAEHPRFSDKEVKEFVIKNYGRDVQVKNLQSDIGQNFHLTDKQGNQYVLKIANPAEHEGILDAQNKLLLHLANYISAINFPYIYRSNSGSYITNITSENNFEYKARLLKYIPGKFLADIHAHSAELLENFGQVLGEIDRSLAKFHHSATQRYWHWDLKNALDLSKQLKYIDNPRRRSLVEYFFLQFEQEVLPNISSLRKSVIQNDPNIHNVLVGKSEEGEHHITGLIDFGDMVYSCMIFELAIAIAYIMLDKENPMEDASFVVKGYHEANSLTELEIKLLFYSACARLCSSVIISAYQKNQQPDNQYVSISEQSVWELLERLLEFNPEYVYQKFRRVCGFQPELKSGKTKEDILQLRNINLSRALSISYQEPLKIVKGAFQYLYDEAGNTYLDAVNNVAHVGHCHPTVVKAAQKQMAILNTNTRYLHDLLVEYAQRLTDLLPDPLNVCFFVNSGSEANELAIRLAKAHTNGTDFIIIDNAYHGNTSALIDISPYKFNGPGGKGKPDYVHKVLMPDVYRGPYKSNDPEAGIKYAGHLTEAIFEIERESKKLAGFFAESLMSCGGQIVFPENYLKQAYQYVRKAGGVCIADEVQVGFGRPGSHFWGFETQNVIPDIVTLGKPIGNGHPLGAVVTTAAIAESFNTGMEYFNTFGGNPVSCAVGLVVLDIIGEEKLQENALRTGQKLKEGLTEIMKDYPIVGDVRGMGLFLGVELVSDSNTLEPATEQAKLIINKMKAKGILISTDGPLNNVLKIKPPLIFTEKNVEKFLFSLLETLEEIKF